MCNYFTNFHTFLNLLQVLLLHILTALSNLTGLLTKHNVNLLLYPVLVVRRVGLGRLVIDQAGNICQHINEIKQLTDIIGYVGCDRVGYLQVLLIHLTNTLQTLANGLVVAISPALHQVTRLDQQDSVGHPD